MGFILFIYFLFLFLSFLFFSFFKYYFMLYHRINSLNAKKRSFLSACSSVIIMIIFMHVKWINKYIRTYWEHGKWNMYRDDFILHIHLLYALLQNEKNRSFKWFCLLVHRMNFGFRQARFVHFFKEITEKKSCAIESIIWRIRTFFCLDSSCFVHELSSTFCVIEHRDLRIQSKDMGIFTIWRHTFTFHLYAIHSYFRIPNTERWTSIARICCSFGYLFYVTNFIESAFLHP